MNKNDIQNLYLPPNSIYKMYCCWCDSPLEATRVNYEPFGGWTVIQSKKDCSVRISTDHGVTMRKVLEISMESSGTD